ncbi:MAG: hypothetical protein LBJ69_02420, partial [Holosporales bacterium]|nr:hypothetical protein [Holosporales bacterium]
MIERREDAGTSIALHRVVATLGYMFLHGLNIVGLKRRGFAADTIREMMSAYKDMFVTPGESINF